MTFNTELAAADDLIFSTFKNVDVIIEPVTGSPIVIDGILNREYAESNNIEGLLLVLTVLRKDADCVDNSASITLRVTTDAISELGDVDGLSYVTRRQEPDPGGLQDFILHENDEA